MLYHVSLLGVLVALMLFSLSINCEQHISLFIIHEHMLTFLLADTCESCLTGYIVFNELEILVAQCGT